MGIVPLEPLFFGKTQLCFIDVYLCRPFAQLVQHSACSAALTRIPVFTSETVSERTETYK